MSTKESWQLTMRKSASVSRIDVDTQILSGRMREQGTRRTLRNCTKISIAACFAANVVPNLISLIRMMTPKLANEGSDENLLR